jgi:hypothetical protein
VGLIDFGIFINLFFNGIVLAKQPFEFYISYVPLIILLLIFIAKYKFPKETIYILVPLLITGILNVFLDNNTYNNLFKIFVNIAINIIFYRYVIEYYEYDVNKIIKIYLKWAYIVSILGLVQLISFRLGIKFLYDWRSILPLNKWGVVEGGLGLRINSTFTEPSYYGSSMAPAFFIAFYDFVFKRELFLSRNKALVILIAYVLTFSSLAFVGVFITIVLVALNFGVIRYFIIAIPLAVLLYFGAYNYAKEFRVRVDGLSALFIDNILEDELSGTMSQGVRMRKVSKVLQKIHGSPFVLYNNMHVATENFKQNPFFGSGLGSHEIAFQNYNLNYMLGGIYEFNAPDANSMFLRTMSELGLMGVLFIFMFISKFFVSKNLGNEEDERYWIISNALLVIIFTQLLRQGNYTFNGFMLYAWMYYFNKLNYLRYVEDKQNEEKPEELVAAQLN